VDLKLVEQLLALMKEGELTELHYVQGDVEVRLVRQAAPVIVQAPAMVPLATSGTPIAVPPAAALTSAAAVDEAEYFRSPMVGTFYRRANPESENYVDPGETVQPETVLCLIEAMKVFNEIKAEFHGTVLEALVQDGETVEFNQPLFKIRK
jgi:acetyl-CoA carboxylase biotin carboxyl carrier protein